MSWLWIILLVSLVCFNRSILINLLIKGFIAFRHSTPSPDGQLVATIHNSCVLIRSCVDNGLVQSFEGDRCFTGVCRFARWYGQERKNPFKPLESRANDQRFGILWRFLLADEDFVHTYDANGVQQHVRISNLAGQSGSFVDIQFGSTEDQILLFSDFGLKVILLTLSTRRGVELKAPKQTIACYGHRPRTGHLALLTRPSLHDVLLYLKPDGSGPVVPVEPATVDAQGILWSPDGQWLVLWDIASAGYKVLIFTADGHLYKTYCGGQDADTFSLGVKTLRWSPSGEILAIGDFDNRVILLKNNTVCVCLPSEASIPYFVVVRPGNKLSSFDHRLPPRRSCVGGANQQFWAPQLRSSVSANLSFRGKFKHRRMSWDLSFGIQYRRDFACNKKRCHAVGCLDLVPS